MALGIGLPSCNRKKVVAPPAAPAAVVLPKREPPKPPTLPPAPKIATAPPTESPVNVEVTTAAPPPKPEPPPKKRGRVAKKKEAPPPQEVKTAEVRVDPNDPTAGHPPATPAPATPTGLKLGQMLPPEQTKDFLKRFDSSTERARGIVLILQGKILNDEQKETVGRIKAFLEQAVATKDQDLVNAVSLAERADLLSKDLMDRMK